MPEGLLERLRLRLLTRWSSFLRVLFLLILPLPASYHGKRNLDFEEITGHGKGPWDGICLCRHCERLRARHKRLLLHATSPTPTPSIQAEYWPNGQDA